MGQTDRQTDKTTHWAMTVYEAQWPLLDTMPPDIAEWGWQDEVCPDTGRKHKQGYFRTSRQHRFKGLKPNKSLCDLLPGVHCEPAHDWNALRNYCKKPDTRDPNGESVHKVNANKPMTMADALTKLAKYAMTEEEQHAYTNANKKAMSPRGEYDRCVRMYLFDTDNANAIGLFTNNQMYTGWIMAKGYWQARYKKMLVESIEDASPTQDDAQASSQECSQDGQDVK